MFTPGLWALAGLNLAPGRASGEAPVCEPPTTWVVVRHADREGSADALSAQGSARAQTLVHVAEKLGISAIYESDTNRAHETAVPLAAALGVTPYVYPAGDVPSLAAQVFEQHRGATVLVVGHSNTVPLIIAAAGGPSLPNLDEGEFDNLFLLSASANCPDATRLMHLQYGEASP